MKRRCIIFVVLMCGMSFAATPQYIRYQGRLKQNGSFVTGERFFEFKITNSDGSSVYWTSGSTKIYVSNGLFRHTLGATTGGISGVDWENVVPYLEVNVGVTTPDTVLLPRERIVASAYALNADKLDGKDYEAFVSTSGDTMGGSLILKSNLQVDGNITTSGAEVTISSNVYIVGYASATVYYGDGSNLTGIVSGQWSDEGSYIYANNFSTMVVTDSGRVGIGTTTPSVELHVIGDIKASGEITGSNIGSDGFSCPEGMVKVGSFCIDKYEASVWSSPTGGTQYGVSSDNYPCNDNGNDCGKNASNPIYARSIAGVTPSRYITWFQAAQACANVGKRLCTNMEWQTAASGTPDNSTDCNINTSGVENTDARPNCVSSWGVYNMVGNLWEWVAC